MIRRSDRRALVAGTFAAVFGIATAAASLGAEEAAPTAERIERGRRIFRSGQASGGPVTGTLGAGGVELRGELVACGSCHGAQGQGSFGGEAAPPLQARILFRPAAADASGRGARPAYDTALLRRALVEGIGAGGRPLSTLMPRFDLGEGDLADLEAWLRVLGVAPEAGVSEERIAIGTVLPLSGRLAAVGEDVAAVIRAAFADAGPIYGRRLELVVEDAAAEQAVARLADRPVFALVGNLRNGAAPGDRLLEREKLPLVGPVGFAAPDAEATPTVFWLWPGPAQQARWAVQQLVREVDGPLAVVAAEDEASSQWAAAAIDEAERLGRAVRREAATAPTLSEAAAVLFSGTATELGRLAVSLPEQVALVAPGTLAAAPGGAALERVRFVHPAELSPPGEAFRAFAARHGLPDRNRAFQATAFAAAQLLVESLRRTGAEPTREGLVRALETVRDFETGVTPALTFGPWRRLGVGGARFARFENGDLVAASEWRPLASR